MRIARAALSTVAALAAGTVTATIGLFITEGQGRSRADLVGMLSITMVAGAALVIVAHLPLLMMLERRGALTMPRAVAFATLIANAPVYVVLTIGELRGGAFGGGEAALFATAFAVLGVVFAVVFTRYGRPADAVN